MARISGNTDFEYSLSIRQGNARRLKTLGKHKIKPCEAAMLHALVHKHADLLAILARNGADPNDSDGFGETALGHAVEFCDSKVVDQLLELGADPEVESLMTKPLVQAALFGKTDNVRVLLEHGANPNSPQASGLTALLEAARYGYREIVEMLLKYGADPDYKGPGGLNASAVARRAGKRDIVNS